jgi:dTDP-4-dehydrorhamnose reductase
MNPKVLVLGSTGMLGHQLCNYLMSNSEFTLFDVAKSVKFRSETTLIDVTDEKKIRTYIERTNPDYIVNCIGVLIGGSNKSIENAILLNSYLPHMLARVASETNSILIHISTDCVFSGKKGEYVESDYRDGQGVYAQTKILGEVRDSKNLTLRTSIIGPEIRGNGEGLFHWFMSQEGSVSGFVKAIWSGVTTIELAKAVKWSIDHQITGIYHVTNNSSISKHDLLQLIQKYTKKDISIKAIDGKDVDKSFIDTRLLMDYEIPSYDQMISDMVNLIANNSALYPQYKVGNF